VSGFVPRAQYRTGRENDLMLGFTHPWHMALGQSIPIAAMAGLIRYSESWLAVLMIFSAIGGAVTSQAAARSRRLWLRTDRDRKAIVRHVELAFWRFNSSSLIVLLALFGALALYAGFAAPMIVHGCILLLLGCAACTYLGLMITRGLGWFESILCVLTLGIMIMGAVATMREFFTFAVELELLLAALAVSYRHMATSRWSDLDWMRCRA
jgi:hypothetical protein